MLDLHMYYVMLRVAWLPIVNEKSLKFQRLNEEFGVKTLLKRQVDD